MVRETSQWEREEMEKVVSEATWSSCSWGAGGGGGELKVSASSRTRQPV